MSDIIGSITAIITLVYVVITFCILRVNRQTLNAMREEMLQEKSFRVREHFLSGIGTIAQYDIDSPGSNEALRLLNYYSRIALDSNDPELLLILNIVMTAEIRKKLEEIRDGNKGDYSDAVEARNRIQKLLRDSNLRRKGLISAEE